MTATRSSIKDIIPEFPPALVTGQWLKEAFILSDGELVHQENNVFLKETRYHHVSVLDASWEQELDCNGYAKHYKRGHIPGAIFFDLHALSQPKSTPAVRCCPIPDKEKFESFVTSLGVTKDTHVIIYDSLDSRSAARAWFLFRLFGHDRVSVLDGGLHQWQSDGHEICTADRNGVCRSEQTATPLALSPHTARKFKADFRSGLLRNFAEMKAIAENKEAQIIDCRPLASTMQTAKHGHKMDYSMLASPSSPFRHHSSGHIKGAINIPYTNLFTPEGTFKSEEDLVRVFEGAGVDLSVPAVVYSERGMTSCCVVLAAALCGTVNLAVYNGSWLEWEQSAPSSLIDH